MDFPNNLWVRLFKVGLIIAEIFAVIVSIAVFAELGSELSISYVFLFAGSMLLGFSLLIEIVRRIVGYIVFDLQFFKIKLERHTRVLFVISGAILLIGCILFPFVYMSEKREAERVKQARLEKLKSDYLAATEQLPAIEERANECWEKAQSKAYEEKRKVCTKERDKVRADYNFCMSLTSINTHASCIYDHDYTVYDCSDEGLRKRYLFMATEGSCNTLFEERTRLRDIVAEYNNAFPD